MVEQGGFTRSKKSGENGNRNARVHSRAPCLNERSFATACLIKTTMTPLVLLVGFLGSGKTTFLKNLLPRLQEHGIEPHVVINDYQNAQVDAEQLRGLAAEIAAISGDCVCCGSREELVTGLEKFEHAPGRIVLVETNGTTDSEQLIEILALERNLRHFSLPVQLSVIDAQRWQKRFWHNALEREQARTASHLFVSRLDTVKDSRVAEVEQSFERHRVRGRRVSAVEFASELSALCEELALAGERSLEPCEHCGRHHDEEHQEPHHDHSEHHFSSLEVPLPERIPKKTFAQLLRNLPHEVIRAKGLVRFAENPDEFFVFQKVDRFDEPQFFPIGNTVRINRPLALFIGPNLPEQTLRASLAELASSLP
jgi:G3E family GTPase